MSLAVNERILRELLKQWRQNAKELKATPNGSSVAREKSAIYKICAAELEAALTRGAVGVQNG